MNKWRKRRHFKRQLRITEAKIWDTQFLSEKAKKEREGFRLEYDRIGERIEQTENKMKTADKKSKKTLGALLDNLKKDYSQLEQRMKGLDQWIDGPLVEPGDPSEMDRSIKANLDGLRAVAELTDEYRRNI